MIDLNSGPQTDFAKMSTGEIFNNTVVSILNDLEQNAQRIDQQRTTQFQDILNASEETTDLLSSMPEPSVVEDEVVDYNLPLAEPMASPPQSQGGYKLSNYGYASDSSPDYNSNVLKIGHAQNPLKDGVSAALSKSLAKKYGLKTGDWFEIETDKGIMKRRYDDTVPATYKGKPLPETVDLYELRGSNSFGGVVKSIRPLK